MFTRIFCLLAILAFPCRLLAGDIVSIDQSKIRHNVIPGQSVTGVINVENTSAEPKTVKVYLEDWFYIPPFDGAKSFTPAGGNKLSCADWITFSPTELVLAPYGKHKVNYSIKVPEGVQGGRYAAMFFENSMNEGSAAATAGVGVNVSLRLACLFYVEAGTTAKLDPELKNFAVRNSPPGLVISLDIANKGNIDMTCQGTFNLMDAQGNVHARGDMSSVYTMPGDTGTSNGTWSIPLKEGSYDLVLTFDAGKAREESGLGRGPVVVREAAIAIGPDGKVHEVGELK